MPEQPVLYKVWAIQYEYRTMDGRGWRTETVSVSAESEYGAIKRLCGNRLCIPKKVELLEGRQPEFAQRRIEGFIKHTFDPDLTTWEYS